MWVRYNVLLFRRQIGAIVILIQRFSNSVLPYEVNMSPEQAYSQEGDLQDNAVDERYPGRLRSDRPCLHRLLGDLGCFGLI